MRKSCGVLSVLALTLVLSALPAFAQDARVEAAKKEGKVVWCRRDITAPRAKSGIIAAWCFIFIGVIRERWCSACWAAISSGRGSDAGNCFASLGLIGVPVPPRVVELPICAFFAYAADTTVGVKQSASKFHHAWYPLPHCEQIGRA